MITLTRIGTIKSDFTEKADPFEMRKHQSRIIIDEKYREGLFRLAESPFIQVVFGFHLSEGFKLKGPVYTGETKGVFASRGPNRPSPLGVTTVKLIALEHNVLTVTGLDALDGSPVFDIKPHAQVFDEDDAGTPEADRAYADPRTEMIRLVRSNDLAACLLKAGTLHGHFCPGLALGVFASVTGMNRARETHSDGMENLLAIVETNNCFADGVQAVTGCTFGNNALVYHDLGKTAVTLVRRGKSDGLRVSAKPGFGALLGEHYPEFSRLFEKVVKQRAGTDDDLAAFKLKGREASFGVLSFPVESLFDIKTVSAEAPPYAPIVESLVCDRCGEQVMESKAVKTNDKVFCKPCAGAPFPRLTGAGITGGR